MTPEASAFAPRVTICVSSTPSFITSILLPVAAIFDSTVAVPSTIASVNLSVLVPDPSIVSALVKLAYATFTIFSPAPK